MDILWVGKAILRRLRKAERTGVAADGAFNLPQTAAEVDRWEKVLGVSQEKFKGRLIQLAAEARHIEKAYNQKRAKTAKAKKRKGLRNQPAVIGTRTRKRKLKRGKR